MEAFEYSPSGKLTYHLKDPQNSWLDDDFPSTIVPFQGDIFNFGGVLRNYEKFLLTNIAKVEMFHSHVGLPGGKRRY